MAGINTGEFEVLVRFNQVTQGQTASGSPDPVVSEFSTAWAKRETVSINEEIAGRKTTVLEKYKFTTHYQAVDESFILEDVETEEQYNILSVQQIDKIFMEIVAEKIQS